MKQQYMAAAKPTHVLIKSRLIGFLLLASAGAGAQEEQIIDTSIVKQFQVTRVETPPVIDGVLDDEVWQQAELITDFHQMVAFIKT